MESTSEIFTESQLHSILIELMTKAAINFLPIIIYSVIQLIRLGNQSDYLYTLIGCIFSILFAFGYVIAIIAYGFRGKKSCLASFLVFASTIPYLFCLYLFFYKGLWFLKGLANGFSISIILKSLLFMVFGYSFLSKLYKISEIGKFKPISKS